MPTSTDIAEQSMARHTLLIEKTPGGHLRGIIWDTDPDTGAKCVVELFETERDNMVNFAMSYDVSFNWQFDGKQLAEINVGRAHTKRGILTKLVEQI